MAICRSLLVVMFAFASNAIYAHGGGIDRYGCHNDRKHGSYHCHQGPLAGKSFASKEAMLKELEGPQGEKRAAKQTTSGPLTR